MLHLFFDVRRPEVDIADFTPFVDAFILFVGCHLLSKAIRRLLIGKQLEETKRPYLLQPFSLRLFDVLDVLLFVRDFPNFAFVAHLLSYTLDPPVEDLTVLKLLWQLPDVVVIVCLKRSVDGIILFGWVLIVGRSELLDFDVGGWLELLGTGLLLLRRDAHMNNGGGA